MITTLKKFSVYRLNKTFKLFKCKNKLDKINSFYLLFNFVSSRAGQAFSHNFL